MVHSQGRTTTRRHRVRRFAHLQGLFETTLGLGLLLWCRGFDSDHEILGSTRWAQKPVISMEPENTSLDKENNLPNHHDFRFYVNLPGCKWSIWHILWCLSAAKVKTKAKKVELATHYGWHKRYQDHVRSTWGKLFKHFAPERDAFEKPQP